MTASVLDISMPLVTGVPIWPGSPGFSAEQHLSLAAGDIANATLIRLDAHCGTHVDAPRHVVPDGATLDEVGLEPLIGTAWVSDASGHELIDERTLAESQIPAGTERLLLRTDNASRPGMDRAPFQEDYVALTPDGAQWIVRRGIRLIGIDYLSIQRFSDPPDTHEILLNAGVLILEGLDLRAANAGSWMLFCLPMRLIGTEAAPARAVLLKEGSDA